MRSIKWFRRNVYGQYVARVLLAIGSAAVTIALSYLPYDTILQAIWMIVASMFMGFFVLQQRLNETDDIRYRPLFRTRFAHLDKADPEALTTIFADNIRRPVLDWFADEYDIRISDAKNIDAIDSLARPGLMNSRRKLLRKWRMTNDFGRRVMSAITRRRCR